MANLKPEVQEKWDALSADARSLLIMTGRLSDKGVNLELLRSVWQANAGEDASARFKAALAELDAEGAWFATKKAEIRKLKSPSRRALPELALNDEAASAMSDERLFDLVSGLAYGEIARAFARKDWSKDPTTQEDGTAQIAYLAPKMKGFRYLEAKCVDAARFFMKRDRSRYLSRQAKLAEELDDADLPDNFGQALGLHQTSFRAWMERSEAAGSMEQLPARPEYDVAALNALTEGLARLEPGENVSPFFAAGLHMGVASAWQTDARNANKALETLRAGLPILDALPEYPKSEDYPESAWGALVKTMYPLAVQMLERQLDVPEAEQTFAGKRMMAPPERFPSLFSIGDLLALDRSTGIYYDDFDRGVQETVAARARANMLELLGSKYDPVANIKSPFPMVKKSAETWPVVMEAVKTADSPETFTKTLCQDVELFVNLAIGLRGADLFSVFDGFMEQLEKGGFSPDRLPEAGRVMIADLLHRRASAEICDLSPEKPSVIALQNLRPLTRFGYDMAWLRYIKFIGDEFADSWHEDANDALVERLGRAIDESRAPDEGTTQAEALKIVAETFRLPELLGRVNEPAYIEEYQDRMNGLADRIEALIPEAKTPRDFFAVGKTALKWTEEFDRFDSSTGIEEIAEELVRAMQANGAEALVPAMFARRVLLAAQSGDVLGAHERADLEEALEVALNLTEYYDESLTGPGADFSPEEREIRDLSMWLFSVEPPSVYGKTDAYDLRDLLLCLLWAECVQCIGSLKRRTPAKIGIDAKKHKEFNDANIKLLQEFQDKVENACLETGRIEHPKAVVKEVFQFNYVFNLPKLVTD